MSSDPNFDKVYEQAKEWISNEENLTATNVMDFVTFLMPIVQKITIGKKRGEYKKQLVMNIITKVIENDAKFESDEDKRLVLKVVENTVPVSIDLLVAVATGKIDIKNKVKQFCFCFF